MNGWRLTWPCQGHAFTTGFDSKPRACPRCGVRLSDELEPTLREFLENGERTRWSSDGVTWTVRAGDEPRESATWLAQTGKPLPPAIRRVVVYHIETGAPLECAPIDAKELLAGGEYSLEEVTR